MNAKQLSDLKDEIEEAKRELSEHKGQLKALMGQLKTEWDCGTITQAKKKQAQLEDELDELDNKIEEGIKEIEEKYPQ